MKTNNNNKTQKDTLTSDPEQIAGDLLKEALELEIPIELKQEKTINKDTFDTLIELIAKEYKTQPAMAIIGLFCTLQAGGTNNGKRSNVKITIDKIAFESKVINSIINKTCKGITPRQFARIFANQIYQCSVKYYITGNSYIYLSRFHPQLLLTEKKDSTDRQWCADFQVDNPNCPEYIRAALRQRYNDKFRRNISNNKTNK